MHFAMHAFSSYVEVLNKVTPIDLLVQSAVLFSLTGWYSPPMEGWQVQPDGVVHSPPMEGNSLPLQVVCIIM